MSRIALFDAADYLDSEEVIAEYLNAALEDENPDVFLQAVADVAKIGELRCAGDDREVSQGRKDRVGALSAVPVYKGCLNAR